MKLKATIGILAMSLGIAACETGVPPQMAVEQNEIQVSKPSDTEIVVARTIAAPPQAVFAAMTHAEHILRWLQPANMVLVNCEVDLRVGGKAKYSYQRLGGRKLQVIDTYEVVQSPNKIAFIESYDFSPLKISVTATFDDARGKTDFKQTLKYSSKQERDEDFAGVASSAADAYRKLEHYLLSVKR